MIAYKVKISKELFTFKDIADRLNIKPNSANARVRRLQRVLGRQELTWQELEHGSRGFVYRKKLPAKYQCRNELRKQLVNKGISFQTLANRIGSTRQHVDRVLGSNKKNTYKLTPAFVTRVCKVLDLDELDTAYMHELGARENGWEF